MKSKKLFPLALLLFIGSTQLRLHAQCANDTIQPIALCVSQLVVNIGPDDPNDCYGPEGPSNNPPALDSTQSAGVAWVHSSTFDDGSYDDCNNIKLTIRRATPLSDCIIGLNATNGYAPCNDLFPDFPSEFERAISEQDSIKFYSCQIGFTENNVILRAYQVDDDGNFMLNAFGHLIFGECWTTVLVQSDTMPPAIVSGKVFTDTSGNCSYNTGEPLLAGWRVKITGLVTGQVYETLTNASGNYTMLLLAADTSAEVSLAVPFNVGQFCPTVHTVSPVLGQTVTQDIVAHLEEACPILSVDISALFLRRCFPNIYTAQACNLSNGTVEDVRVEVNLDSYMTFNSSSISATPVGGNTYSFNLGDMQAGECINFNIYATIECAAPLGYTHCTEAHIFPDTICNESLNWNGADLEVTGLCDGDSVRLTISNIGTGNMDGSQDFVVVEDVIMYQSVPFQLNSQGSQTIVMPANGATWRLETDEVPNHPWGGVEAKAVEGCGGLNETGLVTMFPLNTPNPFETIDCQENTGSYDPNDKQAFPKGYLDEHFIKANTDIEYHIRFQNTGTDTAFTVVVLDTLSQHLDAASIRPGAASHSYDFAVLDGNILRFKFDNILLPDSNVNEAASHGFVKFRASQKPNNTDGTRIENRAAIYFDFNNPVLTNTTFHTIGDHFVLVNTDEGNPAFGVLRVYPNPSADVVIFEMPNPLQHGVFELTNGFGQKLRSENVSGGQYRFERGQLPAGLYFYQISDGTKQISSGKILLK